MINIFGIDPGATTGWAYAKDIDLATLPHGDCDVDIVASQFAGDENQQAWDLFRIIKQVWPVAVVIEDFIPRKLDKSRHFLSPVRVTEKLDMLLWRENIRHFRQMPSTAMTTISDDYLRAIGMWLPGEPHANDAQRHVVTFTRMLLKHPERYEQIIAKRTLEVNG
jgi:hypothetical protein